MYDVVLELSNHTRFSHREEGDLEDFIAHNKLNKWFAPYSFAFSGDSECQLLIDGELQNTGTYVLVSDRLALNFYSNERGPLFTFEYKTSPATIFVWNWASFYSTFGVELTFTGLPAGLSVVSYEFWVEMDN